MPRYTARTITSPSRYALEIRRARARGYAEDREEQDVGAACIAAPIVDAQGVVGAISISAPASRMSVDRVRRLAPALVEACEALSRQLGSRRPPGATAAHIGRRTRAGKGARSQ
jgi:IclR family acetate operon transcriptional repressor